MKQSTKKISDLRKEVINFLSTWHNNFILDYWWRKKYNVPFGSEQHRNMNFIDMLIEYQEEIEIKKRCEEKSDTEEEGEIVSKEELKEDYDNLNLEDYNEQCNS